MKFHSVLRALRSDDAPQREAQEALIASRGDWRGDPRSAPALAALDAFGRGAALADSPALGALFGSAGAAQRFVGSLIDHLLPALAERPLGMVPMRHVSERGVASLLVARSGGAMLMISAREPGRIEQATAGFNDGERHEIVLAGKASARLVTLLGVDGGKARFGRLTTALRPGGRFALDQAREALQVEWVEQRLVTLRLLRTPQLPQPSRAFALSDGALVHQASGEIGESRLEMMLALLGRMERRDAAPLMAEMALADGSGGSPHLRWQALRECLALDSASGFRALCAIACDAADPLAAAAGALRAQLVEAHPGLAELEDA